MHYFFVFALFFSILAGCTREQGHLVATFSPSVANLGLASSSQNHKNQNKSSQNLIQIDENESNLGSNKDSDEEASHKKSSSKEDKKGKKRGKGRVDGVVKRSDAQKSGAQKGEEVEDHDEKEENDKSSKININTASADLLTTLPGVGPATAKKIIAYREKRPFRRTSDLTRIRGIGAKRLQKLAPLVTVK